MALSREEIEQIAFRIAGTIVGVYREPTSVADGLSQSMLEEAVAGNFYRRRAESADPETAKLYRHIASEEDGHLEEFAKRLNEVARSEL
jgi:rubrerythrin